MIILNLVKFLSKNVLKLLDNEYDTNIMAVVDTWNHRNFMFKKHVLKWLNNKFYKVYSSIKSSKVLWDVLN
jgi:hypothetical protein